MRTVRSIAALITVQFLISAAAPLLSMAWGPALYAATVSVTGGFTTFSGVVGGTNQGITSIMNGQPLCADSGCANTDVGHATFNALGVSSVTFQNFSPSANPLNLVQFLPAAAQNVSGNGPGNQFLLGQLTFTNGIWTGDASFGFTLTTHSSDATLDGKSITDTLVMRVTTNVFGFGANTPAQNADFVYFSGNPVLGSARAYELQDTPTGTNTVTVDVLGYIDSLHLSQFTNAQGGFIDPSTDLTPAAATPLPAALPLFASGVGALGLLGWRRKRKAAKLAA